MKRNNYKKIVTAAIAIIYFSLSSLSAFASNINEISPETLAVTLVIDTSGSMEATDPQNLRETASNIFIDLLSQDDYLGIITFNSKENVVVPMQQIKNNENKSNFKNMVSQELQSTGGDTDYQLALNEASKQLKSIDKGNIRKVILFLTDGEPDPDNTKKNDAAFMNSYMDSLWNTVSDLAINRFSVYSVGFSTGVDSAILDKISSSTQGTLKISDDSSELALSFFDILGSLKNRKSFLDKSFELNGSQNFQLDLDEFTSQSTMVFINPSKSAFDIAFVPPIGINEKNAVTINKSDKYTIVTINQNNKNLSGKWQVNLKGEGTINSFGNKDLFIKPWLISPERASLQPLNEPLDISVNVTGEASKNLSMEAVITKNGIKDATPIKLELTEGLYKATYKNVDKIGKYDIELMMMLSEQVISKDTMSFTVRELPSIYTDFLQSETTYRIGENPIVKSSLKIGDNNLLLNNDLKIENYNLLLNYINRKPETIELKDNGLKQAEDVKANDGIWSNKILWNKEENGTASIVVSGIYKGEKFLIEKSLGNFEVFEPGTLRLKQLENELYTTKNKQLKIPIEIENASKFKEILKFEINEDIGYIYQDEIELNPSENLKTYILVNTDKNIDEGTYNINIKISSKNPLTKVEPSEINTKVEVLSETALLFKNIEDSLFLIGIFVGSLIVIVLLVILLGLFLYRLVAYKNTIIRGELLYWKESDGEGGEKGKINFKKFHKDKITISFNKDNKQAQGYVENSKYNYDIEFQIMHQEGKWKFVEGYRALRHKNNSYELLLKTTKPGIFIYEGKVFTTRKINKNDKFTSGGYVFQYYFKEKAQKKMLINKN